MKCCAICGAGPCPTTEQPLGRNDAMVPVCAECDGPIEVRRGPDLAYEPCGFVSSAEADAGMRRVLGEDEAERANEMERRGGIIPSAPVPEDEQLARSHWYETIRRSRTKANKIHDRRSSRARKLF